MTLPRFDAICAHWEKVPPLSVMVKTIAVLKGWKPDPPRNKLSRSEQQVSDRQALFDALGGAPGFKTEKPEWVRLALAQMK